MSAVAEEKLDQQQQMLSTFFGPFSFSTRTGIDKFCLLLRRFRHYDSPGKSEYTRDKEGGWNLKLSQLEQKSKSSLFWFFFSFDRKSIRFSAARWRSLNIFFPPKRRCASAKLATRKLKMVLGKNILPSNQLHHDEKN